jgi:hypothetical protein
MDRAGNENTCTTSFKKDDATEIDGCTISQKDKWTSEEGYTITTTLTTNPISGCKTDTGKYHSVGNDCRHVYGQPVPDNAAVDTVGHTVTFVTNSGVSYVCSGDASVKIDNIPPECESSGGDENWVNHNLTVIGTCTDNIECDGETVSLPEFTSNTEQYNVTPGIVKDIAGNETQCPANQTVKIDKTPPTCETTATASDWTNADVTITGTCNDNGGSQCTDDTKKVLNIIDYETNSSYSPGTVKDGAGNETPCDSIDVKIDKTAPSCSIDANTSEWTNQDVTITVSGEDSDSGLTSSSYIINGELGVSTSVSTNGTYDASVTDRAGNTKPCDINITNIDKTPPKCELAVTDSGVSISCSDDGGSGYVASSCKLNNGRTSAYLRYGTISGSVRDGAKNTGTCSVSISYAYPSRWDMTTHTCTYSTDTSCDWDFDGRRTGMSSRPTNETEYCSSWYNDGKKNYYYVESNTTAPTTVYCCVCSPNFGTPGGEVYEYTTSSGTPSKSGYLCHDCTTCSSGNCSQCSTTTYNYYERTCECSSDTEYYFSDYTDEGVYYCEDEDEIDCEDSWDVGDEYISCSPVEYSCSSGKTKVGTYYCY